MVNRVFCDQCGDEITQYEYPEIGEDDANLHLIAHVKIIYYRDLHDMQKDDEKETYNMDLCTECLAEMERTYDIIPVTGEKKEAAEPHV